MIRIFLRLYFLILLPLTLVYLLPINPINYFGGKMLESHFDHEYSSTYELINNKLSDTPEDTWAEQAKELAPHFPLGIGIKPLKKWKLKQAEEQRLMSQGYILQRKPDLALFYRIRDTQKVLKFGLNDRGFSLTEQQTRGIRYLVNEVIFSEGSPEENFKKIKPFFKVPVELKLSSSFAPDSNVIEGLKKHDIYYNKDKRDPTYIYFISDNKKYIVIAGPLRNSQKLESFFNYMQIIVPAILIALGALIWLYTFLRELKVMNRASKAFGQGDLSTRSQLSRYSTLHSQSHAFNSMAEQVQKLVNGHKDLTNAVSHELKTPLSRLRFALQMQQEASTPKDQQKYTAKIDENIDELESLINELLSYARLDRSKALLTRSSQHYANWLRATIKQLKDYQPDIDIQLNLDKSTETKLVFDSSLMEKILNNLLSNAIRHCHHRICISSEIKQKTVTLLVEDDGKGIDKSYHKQLFQPFFRLDKSRQRKTGGSGMGLALSKKMIALHGGTIKYQKSQWGGSGFLLTWQVKS